MVGAACFVRMMIHRQYYTAYNVHNSPHLSAAYELDTALLRYSENLKSYNLHKLQSKIDLYFTNYHFSSKKVYE